MTNLLTILCAILMFPAMDHVFAKIVDKRKCPEVRAVPHFDLTLMLGDWFVVEYYASAEEALEYSCMRAVFTQDDHVPAADGSGNWVPGVTMNFTYRFADDPSGENLLGNITWRVDLNEPAHWTHAESTYDGIYNTYVLDTEYKTWALLLHCAEKAEGARYLSAFVLSRATSLPKNVMAYLRDKLPRNPGRMSPERQWPADLHLRTEPYTYTSLQFFLPKAAKLDHKRYDVDVQYVFPIPHEDCSSKPAVADNEAPLLVEVGSRTVHRGGVSYGVGDQP